MSDFITPEIQIDLAGTRTPSPQQKQQMMITANQVDCATTPESEIDLEQAQELSKHIVSDIINQAVRRLNDDIKNNKHLKHEPESISKLSTFSQRSMVQNNCSWLTRTRNAIRRIVRHACICTRTKEDNQTFNNETRHHHHCKTTSYHHYCTEHNHEQQQQQQQQNQSQSTTLQ
ncbi:hypothetical protein DERP_003290 [Dermatophagoides pteronyssinus]|uniref:Uncharacterized protein n=1 Tax=Dermatophagoides pteronyssinus TaxID=6956 RepID=A0ABQ8JJK5_DERPT|nr:hypothetical protein DERP_003290 [Dermatophagoides pteronyssinus]